VTQRRLTVAELKAKWKRDADLYSKSELDAIWDDYFGLVPGKLAVEIKQVEEGPNDR